MSLPEADVPESARDRPHLVPLTLLQKSPLISFDLRDESGAAVPVLTREQNGWVAWSLLNAFAKAVLSKDPPPNLIEILQQVVFGGKEEAFQAAENLEKVGPEGSQLAGNPFFNQILYLLAANFLLLVPVKAKSGQRRILKFSYDEPFAWERLRPDKRTLREKLGWGETEFGFIVPAVGYGGTYHFEVHAPPGLEITHADIWAQPVEGDDFERSVEGPTSLVHLYLSDVPQMSGGLASVWMIPERRGLVRAAFFVTLATVSLLTLGLLFSSELMTLRDGQSGSAGSLLLVVPGLASALVARPGEHTFVSRMMLALRVFLVISGICSYLGALTLLVGPRGYNLIDAWGVLAFVSWLSFAASAGAFVRLSRLVEDVYLQRIKGVVEDDDDTTDE